jgi:hypothetical protein
MDACCLFLVFLDGKGAVHELDGLGETRTNVREYAHRLGRFGTGITVEETVESEDK